MATSNKLFVGSLPYSVNDAQLAQIFAEVDEVEEAKVIVDRDQNNRSKGFGFVTMKTPEGAQKAIDTLNGKEVEGRTITVSEARPQENRGPRSGGGGFNNRQNNSW